MLKALSRLLRRQRIRRQPFTSPQEFLASTMRRLLAVPSSTSPCRGSTVSQLQQALAPEASQRPVIFMTGTGDIPTSVRAMKAGALDFLTKPVNDEDLLSAIARADEQDGAARRNRAEIAVDRSEDWPH